MSHASTPTWENTEWGDIKITCPPCNLVHIYRDNVDDVLEAGDTWRKHANHGTES